MGKLIVIEGLDGSGKATQTAVLEKMLLNDGINMQKLSFPNYASPSSALVKMYLSGEFGEDPMAVNAYAAASFYAVDRYASYKMGWGDFYEAGGLLLSDRYSTSNAIHQSVKLKPEERQNFLDWLEEYEYNKLGLPKPDVVIYLDVDPVVSQKLLSERYNDNEEKKDIHEKDLQYMIHCRQTGLWCAKVLGWNVIRCDQNNQMRTREDIAKEIYAIVKEAL